MKENKLWNSKYKITHGLSTKDESYKNSKKSLQVSKNNIASIVLEEIPKAIFNNASLLKTEYKIKGSWSGQQALGHLKAKPSPPETPTEVALDRR